MQVYDTLYLSSLESSRFEPVRACRFISQLSFDTDKQCALAKIDPPVVGQDFNQSEDLDVLLLVNRHEGGTLFPVNEFPCFVFICRPLFDAVENKKNVTKDDMEIIGWGELYRSRDDAIHHNFN